MFDTFKRTTFDILVRVECHALEVSVKNHGKDLAMVGRSRFLAAPGMEK